MFEVSSKSVKYFKSYRNSPGNFCAILMLLLCSSLRFCYARPFRVFRAVGRPWKLVLSRGFRVRGVRTNQLFQLISFSIRPPNLRIRESAEISKFDGNRNKIANCGGIWQKFFLGVLDVQGRLKNYRFFFSHSRIAYSADPIATRYLGENRQYLVRPTTFLATFWLKFGTYILDPHNSRPFFSRSDLGIVRYRRFGEKMENGIKRERVDRSIPKFFRTMHFCCVQSQKTAVRNSYRKCYFFQLSVLFRTSTQLHRQGLRIVSRDHEKWNRSGRNTL